MFRRLRAIIGRLACSARLKPVSKDDSPKPIAEASNTLWAVCMDEKNRTCVTMQKEPFEILAWMMENGGVQHMKGFQTEPEAREFERKCVDGLIRLELANPSTGYMVLIKLVEHANQIGLEIDGFIKCRIDERHKALISGKLSPQKDDPEQPGACAIV